MALDGTQRRQTRRQPCDRRVHSTAVAAVVRVSLFSTFMGAGMEGEKAIYFEFNPSS